MAVHFVQLAVTQPGFAQDIEPSTENDTSKHPIALAVRTDVEPYVINSATTGLEIEIIQAVFAQTSYQPDFQQMPRIRMIQMFDAGSISGVLTQNTVLKNTGCYTDWYIKHRNVGLSVKENNVQFSSFTDLENISVISFDGAKRYLGQEFASRVKQSPRYVESSNQSVHISLLYLGHFDAAIGDEWVLKMAQANLKEKTGAYKPLTMHPIMPPTLYAARFQNQDTCNAFNKGLKTIRQSGEYDKIVDKYYARITAKINGD